MALGATTLDPNNKSSNMTLSNGNLTATISSGTGNAVATRATPGLVYWEVATAMLGTSPRVGVWQRGGVNSNQLGADNYSVGYDTGGNVYINGATTALAVWVAGNNISVALDTQKQRIWFRVNGGNWNNNASNNPVTNVGGIDISTMAINNYLFPAVSAAPSTSTAFTMNFTSGSWTYSAPSGYSAISSVTVTTVRAEAMQVRSNITPPSKVQKGSCQMREGAVMFTAGNAGSPLGAAVTISGNVNESGVNVAKVVRVYDNATGQLLETVTSNGSTGNYSVLCHGRNQVFAVAFDPTLYQAEVYDRITPA